MKEVKQALYASKICSYAQGLNIIKAKSAEKEWGVDLGALSRIWKVGVFRGPKRVAERGWSTPWASPFLADLPVASSASSAHGVG